MTLRTLKEMVQMAINNGIDLDSEVKFYNPALHGNNDPVQYDPTVFMASGNLHISLDPYSRSNTIENPKHGDIMITL